MKKALLAVLVFAAMAALAPSQDLKELEKRVTEFTLGNGMHFIVLERRGAPVASMVLYANVGSANDPAGRTGLAHMFEHMAFKGTDTLGTTNWGEEKKALADVEVVYDKLDMEKNKGPRGSPETIKKLEADLKAAIDKANSFVVKEAYSEIVSRNGGVGMNAFTSGEATVYHYSLPSNRTELWFLLTSQIFRQPILREFYAERSVVRQERSRSVESSQQGKMMEALMTAAFLAHPQRSVGGWASDIENLRAKEGEEFFRKYYVPSNLVAVVSGNVDPNEMKRLADQYFSKLPSGPTPPRVITEEPKQEGERRVTVETPGQPLIFMGYKRPATTHTDHPALTVLAGALSSGRTGILYKEMVEKQKIALQAAAIPSFPTSKYPGIFTFISVPAVGKTVDENQKAIEAIIEGVKKDKLEAAVINRIKTQVRAGLIRSLDSNMGMAQQLASNYMLYGDWRKMFTRIQDIDKVTAEDVQRVARTYLIDSARTVVVSKQPAKGDGK
jgi:predicted Zn-dependent peptidase